MLRVNWQGLFCSALILLTACSGAIANELPVLHLRKTPTPPPLVQTLQDPSAASAWYPSSPTWFGTGGKTGNRNHIEVLATYDSSALYLAFLIIDRATAQYPKGTLTNITLVDSAAVWIQTPKGKRFSLVVALDTNYPVQPKLASGEIASFSPTSNKLTGWSANGWVVPGKSIQKTIRIPWSTLDTSAPTQGSRWKINFVNYNQTSAALTQSTVVRHTWAPGGELQPEQWGTLAFDEAVFSPPAGVSPEASLTLRPASGFGGETTLRAGNQADLPNQQGHEAITQSNWNDWDALEFLAKEYMTFDLSMIPRDRKIISATLQNRFRGHYNAGQTDLYLHVVRLAGAYDPKTVTMMNSPLPVENGFRRLVRASEVGSFIDFDVTDAVSKAFDRGDARASFALAGSSGDINNGKIWDVSFGRADWYDAFRPRLVITFGKPGVIYSAPAKTGSLNFTSVATTSSKNKLTNGTFRYGTVEGHTNTTYWQDSGWVYVNGVNTPVMRLVGDVNPNTGSTALRFMTPVGWMWIKQIATGLVGGATYTMWGWYKGSAAGERGDMRVEFQDASGKALGSMYAASSGSTNWERVAVTAVAPPGTMQASVMIYNWVGGPNSYMLYSDFQLEQAQMLTTYSETMGIYYPNQPRTDGLVTTGGNCINRCKQLPLGSNIVLANKAVVGSYQGFFYIQCPELNHPVCGIRVAASSVPAMGSSANVTGTLGRNSHDELVINAASVTPGTPVTPRGPVALANKSVCGGTQGSVTGADRAAGLNNVGSLLTTWGKVSSLVSGVSMTINDGSGTPIRVVGPTGSAANGKHVRVTGVASIEKVSGVRIRVLRTRNTGDVRVY